jgi:hypothetical protein
MSRRGGRGTAGTGLLASWKSFVVEDARHGDDMGNNLAGA